VLTLSPSQGTPRANVLAEFFGPQNLEII
jgi:hypothetical protein